MKLKLLLAALLLFSLMGNGLLYFNILLQNEAISLLPRVKNELKIVASLIPGYLDKSTVNKALQEKNYEVKMGDEYSSVTKPNTTLSIGSTYFVFAENDLLVQIYSLSNSLEPIYIKQ